MAAGKTDHALERLVFFSDAVFAIAITLLVIEIHVPDVPYRASNEVYWQALAHLAPSFVVFAISFGVIGAFWSGHHRAFTLAGRYDGGILIWNTLLLGTIAFMPFLTAFMGRHYGAPVPTGLYWSWMLLIALLNLRVNRFATGPRMLAADAPAGSAADVRRRSTSVLLAAATAFLLSLLVPLAAPFGMATIPLWIWLLTRLAKRGDAAKADKPE
jgi:uncharacterized membrane protein